MVTRGSVRVCYIVALASCGRIGFDPLATTDAAPCLPSITLAPPPTTPFGPPMVITELSSPDFDDDPTLTGDELEIVFQSARGGTNRLWHATRANRADPFDPPQPLAELDGFAANTPELSRDGLRLRFAAPAVAGGTDDIYLATRADRASAWGTPMRVDALSTPSSETGAAEFLDAAGVVFFSNRAGGNTMGDLWEEFDDTCTGFRTAVLTGGFPTGAVKANPWMRDDGLAVAFVMDGPSGASDVFVAIRPTVGEPFDVPIELTAVDSTNVDDDPWLDDAMDHIYFMSARTLDGEIYYATR